MNKFLSILCVGVCGMALFACQKSGGGGIVVKQDVTVTFKLSGVQSGFTAYNVNDFNVSAKVELRYFVYDPSGKRVKDASVSLDDFSSETDVDLTLSGQDNYTVAAFAYYKSSQAVYSFSDTESLKTLTVTQLDEHVYSDMSSVLGYAVAAVNPSSNTTVSLKSATALVYLDWENIHAKRGGGTATYPLYGDYKATADDAWGDSHTWTITVEKGSSANEVIIKNLLPYFVENGWSWSPEHNVNIFTGTYNAATSTITLPAKQDTGLSYNNGTYSIQLVGGRLDGEYIYYEDLVLTVGNGKLVTKNYMGAVAPDDTSEDAGWWDLFGAGVVFNSLETPTGGGGSEPDEYLILYHNNDIMKLNGGSPQYGTSLGEVNNNGDSVSPSAFSGSAVYSLVHLFPGTIKIFGREYYNSGSVGDTPTSSVNLSAGAQYVFGFDCDAMTISGWQGTLATRSDVGPGKKVLPLFNVYEAPRAQGSQLLIEYRP